MQINLRHMFHTLVNRYLPAIPAALVLCSMVFSHSCANTTQAPTGGIKDTIPPVITRISPLPGSINQAREDFKVTFTFNEYIQVKDPKSIYLSPPQKKSPKYKIKGKSLVVYFEEELEENMTYTLDITGAVADNNEGNMYPGYTYVFSTGSSIDSMYVTGKVQSSTTLMPVKGATVMLYKDPSDSAVFNKRPFASAKTDDWGYFTIRNIPDTLYRLYAIVDEAGDNIFDQNTDKIAFVDSFIQPKFKVNDSALALFKYDMKDTVACEARPVEYELNVFRDKATNQYLKNKERIDERSAYITFQAPNVIIDSLWISGISSSRIITQFNIYQDSLEIWINDRRKIPDTLSLSTRYWKTDSTGTLKPTTETAKLINPKKNSASKSSRRDIKHADTTCAVTLTVSPETVEQYGFQMEFKYPPINGAFDSLELKIINPRQQQSLGKFTVERDSLNLRKYTIMPKDQLLSGYDYILKVPHRKFRDINGYWNDSTEVKVTLPKDDKLSSLSINLTGVSKRYIVDLLGEKRDKVIRSFIVDEDKTLVFPYLKAGRYTLRLTEDANRNGIVDAGSILEHRMPEKVKFYKLNGKEYINIQERMELSQEINVAELFKD